MKIGFDISQTGPKKAGCGFYADGLLRALVADHRGDQYVLYPTFGDGFWDPDWRQTGRGVHGPHVERGLVHRSIDELQSFWRHPPGDLETRLGSPDVLQANNFFCPRGLRNTRVVYVLYDLSFLHQPAWTTEANRITCFDGVFTAASYADFIVAISRSSLEHFRRVFPHYPEERLGIAYPGNRIDAPPPATAARLSHLTPGGFWLMVGTIEPRKNHLGLLRAYHALRAAGETERPLVLGGGAGWLMDDFRLEVERLGLQGDVIQLGYVDDAELRWLYANCFALVYPSLFEGFGMPVLEALACGAAVITSDATSLPEVAGDAALLVDPSQPRAIADAMRRLEHDKETRRRLRRAAVPQANKFTWQRAARAIREFYETARCLPKFAVG